MNVSYICMQIFVSRLQSVAASCCSTHAVTWYCEWKQQSQTLLCVTHRAASYLAFALQAEIFAASSHSIQRGLCVLHMVTMHLGSRRTQCLLCWPWKDNWNSLNHIDDHITLDDFPGLLLLLFYNMSICIVFYSMFMGRERLLVWHVNYTVKGRYG